MGNIHLNINSDIEKRFRDTVGRKWGYHKGNLARGMEEALEMWIANNPEEP